MRKAFYNFSGDYSLPKNNDKVLTARKEIDVRVRKAYTTIILNGIYSLIFNHRSFINSQIFLILHDLNVV